MAHYNGVIYGKERCMKETVTLTGCRTYKQASVKKAIIKGLQPFGGIDSFVKSGHAVLIKPNMLSPKKPEDAVTTHPAIVESVVQLVKECSGIPFIGDSPGIGSMERVARKSAILDICKKYDVELIDLDGSKAVVIGKGSIFRHLKISAIPLDMDRVINLPKIKTHAQMVLTMGIKNLFGCVQGRGKAQWHFNAGNNRLYFARLLIEIYKAIRPAITISDCVVAMEGNGPGAGTPKMLGLIGCGRDAVAHDAVFSTILGLNANALPVIHAAREAGLGISDLNDIDLVAEKSLPELVLSDFEFPQTIDIMFNLPHSVQRIVRNSITSKPVIDHAACTRCMKCIEICPPGIIAKTDSKIEIDHDRCISCFCCQEICPEKAITPRPGWLSRFIS